MSNRLGPSIRGGSRTWPTRVVTAVALAISLGGCRLVDPRADARSATAQDVVAAAGWTKIATTAKYFVVANVLPGEHMYTKAEADAQHPTVGELIISGIGNPLGPDVRHVEAHIYDRETGLPLSNLKPSIEILDHTSGERISVSPTLMQDVAIGALDIHYGNNVPVAGNSDLTLKVTIGDEEVTLDGHLD
ncbi:MAG: hypothetical protein JWN39_1888 [Ilumatobacteraceae bacterium]|nr:hypothetical protein [Ilumatobacteraceae bacterium]